MDLQKKGKPFWGPRRFFFFFPGSSLLPNLPNPQDLGGSWFFRGRIRVFPQVTYLPLSKILLDRWLGIGRLHVSSLPKPGFAKICEVSFFLCKA